MSLVVGGVVPHRGRRRPGPGVHRGTRVTAALGGGPGRRPTARQDLAVAARAATGRRAGRGRGLGQRRAGDLCRVRVRTDLRAGPPGPVLGEGTRQDPAHPHRRTRPPRTRPSRRGNAGRATRPGDPPRTGSYPGAVHRRGERAGAQPGARPSRAPETPSCTCFDGFARRTRERSRRCCRDRSDSITCPTTRPAPSTTYRRSPSGLSAPTTRPISPNACCWAAAHRPQTSTPSRRRSPPPPRTCPTTSSIWWPRPGSRRMTPRSLPTPS